SLSLCSSLPKSQLSHKQPPASDAAFDDTSSFDGASESDSASSAGQPPASHDATFSSDSASSVLLLRSQGFRTFGARRQQWCRLFPEKFFALSQVQTLPSPSLTVLSDPPPSIAHFETVFIFSLKNPLAEMTKKKKVTGVKCKPMKTVSEKPLPQPSAEVVEAAEAIEIIENGSEQNLNDDIIDLTSVTEKRSTTTNGGRTRRSRSEVRAEFYMSKPFKLALSDDEQKLVKYVLSNPEDKDAHEICQFGETTIRRYELHSLTPHNNLYTTIVDAFAHLLNRENIKKNGKVTRFCFSTNYADAVRNEVENEEDESDDNQPKKLCVDFNKLDSLKYLEGVSWEACEYVFFPVHGGQNFEHYWAFAIDFKREQFLCLNSMKCEEHFEKNPCYHDSGERLMSYARSFIEARTGKDISKFKWAVPDAPVQPDLKSCGMFVINFMQHFDGSFTSEQMLWGDRKVVDEHRVRMIHRLVTAPENALLPKIVEAAEAWCASLGGKGKRKKQ
ncbi:hypothetical protein LINPERPRIM_LOCUS9375, partial [Linum perenne]